MALEVGTRFGHYDVTARLDRAHNNLFVYRPENRTALVDLLESDGYQVRELDGPFDRESLARVQIVVAAMALSAQNV